MTDYAEIDTVHETLGALQGELEHLKAATEHIGASREAAQEAAGAAARVVESSQSLLASTEVLLERIQNVDFPNRFDAADKSLAEAHEKLGGVASRQGDLASALGKAQREREALKELLVKAEGERVRHQQAVQTEMAKYGTQQRLMLIALVVLGLINTVLLLAT